MKHFIYNPIIESNTKIKRHEKLNLLGKWKEINVNDIYPHTHKQTYTHAFSPPPPPPIHTLDVSNKNKTTFMLKMCTVHA